MMGVYRRREVGQDVGHEVEVRCRGDVVLAMERLRF
jgi:hypothetical protein